MGCALGTPATSGDGRRHNAATADGGDNAVKVREKQRTMLDGEFSGIVPAPERRRPRLDSFTATPQGWPPWLMAVAGDAIRDWTPRRANTFEKLAKIGKGTYSNVYKARDLFTGRIVALKKVRFDNLEAESVKFMAREILVLRKLDHPNVLKLEGLVTSRISSSLYLVFEYMEHDLAGLAAGLGVKFSEPQVKCYMKQLLSGLEHCHSRGVLHRDIKGSNLLIDNEGILKIADFGLATFYDSKKKHPMTSRVVTLWYRPPELLLGATSYGVGVDLWSAGCILAELLAGKPAMPGRTEVEQLHKIFKLCGSPSEEYWKKYRLPNATLFKPQQPYKRCILETFVGFPSSSLSLVETLLAIDPNDRGTTSAALNSEFFTTEPYACEPSTLPKYPPTKELDIKLREEEARRQKALSGKTNAADGPRRVRVRERLAIPAPEANAEIQTNLDRWRVVTHANAKCKSEKFPPPHQDGAVGYPLDASNKGAVTHANAKCKSEKFPPPHQDGAAGYPLDASNKGAVSFGASETSSGSTIFDSKPSGSVVSHAARDKGRKTNKADSQSASSWKFMRAFKLSTIGHSFDSLFRSK